MVLASQSPQHASGGSAAAQGVGVIDLVHLFRTSARALSSDYNGEKKDCLLRFAGSH
jgi:hypothetical protein